MRWGLALVLLALLAPAVPAQAESAATVSIVVWHAWPDPAAGTPQADPFSSPASPPSARLPRTLVDGVREASDAPEGDPSSPSTHFLEVRRLVRERQARTPDLAFSLSGSLEPDRVLARASVAENVTMVLVEDGVEHDGGSGVKVHRFVARAAMRPLPDGAFEAALDPAWSRERLAVVAWVQGEDGVRQSATWRVTQDGPTLQRTHAPLVEHWTATWCAPCAPSDHALALLAAQSGLPLESGAQGGYATGVTLPLVLGLAGGAAAGYALVRRRAA